MRRAGVALPLKRPKSSQGTRRTAFLSQDEAFRLLEEKVVELNIVGKASDNTIGRTLKKSILKPHRHQQWVIPPEANAGFVAAMEDVLETYQRPRDPERPLVCLDETSKQLIAETRKPIPAKPGRPAHHATNMSATAPPTCS